MLRESKGCIWSSEVLSVGMRRLLVAVGVLAVGPLLGACGSSTPTPLPETRVEVVLSEFAVEPTVLETGPGNTAFFVTNRGAIEHEFVVIRTDTAPDALVVADGVVDQASAGEVVGEIETDVLQPDASGFMSVGLAPGKYVLICNIPGHYEAGMQAEFMLEN
jgi:uncharacterized cupredoxin-like copper-binding protein